MTGPSTRNSRYPKFGAGRVVRVSEASEPDDNATFHREVHICQGECIGKAGRAAQRNDFRSVRGQVRSP